jgi:hypothetical protein
MSVSKPFAAITLIWMGVLLSALTGLLILARVGGSGPSPVDMALAQSVEPAVEDRPVATARAAGELDAEATPMVVRPTDVDRGGKTATPATQPTATSRSPTRVAPATVTPEAQAASWQRVRIPELGLAFDLPGAWEPLDEGWRWQASGGGAIVGVNWAEAAPGWEPTSMLPASWQPVEIRSVDLGWAQGSSYWYRPPHGDGEPGHERHVIVQAAGDGAYDFYASGRSPAEFATLEPVLERMLGSISYRAEPDGPVEVSLQFLTGLLRDASGASSMSLLSRRLQEEVEGGRPPLSLLSVHEIYHSFSVSWLAAADGHTSVQAILNYPGGGVEERVLTLVLQDGGWRIDAIAT